LAAEARLPPTSALSRDRLVLDEKQMLGGTGAPGGIAETHAECLPSEMPAIILSSLATGTTNLDGLGVTRR
jgi:hypothetical protein